VARSGIQRTLREQAAARCLLVAIATSAARRSAGSPPPARGAGKLGRSELGPGKLGSGIVGRWFRAEAVNSVETLSDPQTFAAYIGLLFGPNCN